MTTLLEFLNTRRVSKGKSWNVTGMGKPDKGVYYIGDEDYDRFLTLYTSHVFTSCGTSSLLEKHTEFSPILIDLDFKYEKPKGTKILSRNFTDSDINMFINLYATAFFSFITLPNKLLRFYVMLKNGKGPSLDKGLVKDGIHIVCPDLALPTSIMTAIRLVLLEQGAIEKCFKGLVNSVKDAFDESVIQRNNWFLYGAGKPDSDSYSVTSCVTCYADGSINVERCGLTDLEMVRLFSIRRLSCSEYTICDHMKDVWLSFEKTLNNDIGKNVCVNSAKISAFLNMESDGIWSVTECGEGSYKMLYNNRQCLVNSSCIHSTDGHSCVFVNERGATASCFSHGKRSFVEEGMALWRLIKGESEDCIIKGTNADDDIIDDVFACRKFIELMGDEIHREGNQVYVFDRTTGMWASDETALFSAVHRHRRLLMLRLEKDKDKVYNYGGNTRNIRNMFVHLRSLLCNETFMSDNLNESLKYLLFKDGIFNIETQEFTAGFNKKLVFTARINRAFPTERNKDLEEEINKLLFVLPFENSRVGDYLKMRLARSIAGCYLDKKFICALGEADCSKGTITKAMRYAFDEYVIEWNANNLKYNSRNGMDEAKRLSWIFPLLCARLAISNECRMDKVPIDGNLLKTLASGGDDVDARKNFQEQMRLEIRTSFMYWGNDMPAITPKDSGISTRVRAVRFVKRFVEHPVLPNELPADPSIKTKLGSLAWRNAVFWLIMDAYRLPTTEPAAVVEETKEWVPTESGEFREILEEEYVIDLGDHCYLSSREISEFIKSRNMNMSDTKIGRELAKVGLVKDVKKIGGKTTNIWKGIRKSEQIE
jgi:hypothetical protein